MPGQYYVIVFPATFWDHLGVIGAVLCLAYAIWGAINYKRMLDAEYDRLVGPAVKAWRESPRAILSTMLRHSVKR